MMFNDGKFEKEMKRINFLCAASAAMAAMTLCGISCSNDEAVTPPLAEGTSFPITLTAETAETRTTLNTLADNLLVWMTPSNEATKMGLWVNTVSGQRLYINGKSKNSEAEDLSGGARTSVKFVFESPEAVGSVIRACYPYISAVTPVDAVVPIDIPRSQNQRKEVKKSAGYDASSVIPMVSDLLTEGAGVTVSENNASGNIKMYVLASVIDFRIYDSEQASAGESVERVIFQSDEGYVAGRTEVDLKVEGVPTLEGDSRMAEVELWKATSGFIKTKAYELKNKVSKESASPVYLSIIPGSYTGKIIVKTNKKVYAFPFATPKTFARAEVKEMPLNLSNAKVEQGTAAAEADLTLAVTKFVRKPVAGDPKSNDVVLTVERGNEAVAGFYAVAIDHVYHPGESADSSPDTCLEPEEAVAWGDVFFFGDEAGAAFVPQSDGTVEYCKRVVKESHILSSTKGGDAISCGVIPFDKYGNRGAMISVDNFDFVTTETESPFVTPAN